MAGLPQWQRALLASGAAGGLLLALAIHLSSLSAESARSPRSAAVGGSVGMSLQGASLGASAADSGDSEVHLRAAGEYTHFLRPTLLDTPRSRNFPVTLKDVPHEHLEEAPHSGLVNAGPILPVDFVKEPIWHHDEFGGGKRQEDGFNVARQEGSGDHTLLRCRKMVHMHSKQLVSPKDVSIGMYLLNMDNRPSEPGVFYADFLMYLRQHDRPLQMPDGSDPWNSLGFANAKTINLIQTFGSAKGLRRIQGSFFYSPDMRWYPFDRQKMDITVEQIEYPVTSWVFFPDWHLNGISNSIRFPGWAAALRQPGAEEGNCDTSVDTRTMPGAIKIGTSKYSNLTFSTFTFRVEVDRPPAQGLITGFVPPTIMMSPIMYSYMIDPLGQWPIRLSLGGSAIMSLVFFHTSQARTMPISDYLTAFDKYVYCVYLFIFSNLVALISMVIFFREQLEDPKSVSFELREQVLGISGRTGMYAFAALFLVLFPLWLMYLSNYMAGVVLVAEIAVGVWWLSVEYEYVKRSPSYPAGKLSGGGGDDDDPEFPKLFYGPGNPYTGNGEAVAQQVCVVGGGNTGKLAQACANEWDTSVGAAGGGDTRHAIGTALAHSLAVAEGTSAASGTSAMGLLARADPQVLISGIPNMPRQASPASHSRQTHDSPQPDPS